MSLYNYWVQFVSYIIGANAPEFLYVISFVLFIVLFFGMFFKLIQKMWSF
uniref:Plectrovirus spv1-c74 orf 13 transmembrane protein n=1 Tax=Spiroplasma citri TaxID=2133 RepID=Q14L89_SPICI|nr:plectrovirus spv1-c74 orf 13 transmembrane protein [Spiroplasma citri]